MAVNLKIGDRFSNAKEVEDVVKRYAEERFIQYYIRESRSVEAARKRVKRFIDDNIGVYQVVYCCIKGGLNFKTSSTGERSSSTFQTKCPANIRFTASKDGHALEVVSLNCEHNHAVSEELYRRYPQQRRLPEEMQEKVIDLLKLKANRKLVKEQIQLETGKVVLLRDLTNIAASQKPAEKNNLLATVQKLKTKYGADCHVLSAEDNTFKGLMFCTRSMRDTMAAFPEFLGIDATYKLLDIRAPVYLIHNEDANGMTEIVAVSILVSEDHDSVSWFLNKFKELNPSWERTKCIMADKDLQERSLLKEAFPQANVLICAYHTLRTFNREISCDKLQITPGERLGALALLQKMVHATNEDKYNEYYGLLKVGNKNVLRYFDINWHPIRQEWAKFGKFYESNFLNTTNNRLEAINGKLKSVITPHSSLENFVDGFFSIYHAMSDERDQKAADSHNRCPVLHYHKDGPEHKYARVLTEHASNFVIKQLQYIEKVNVPQEHCDGVYQIETSRGLVDTSAFTCSCIDAAAMLLPCRHTLAVRRHKTMDLFSKELCAERWTKDYYQENQRLFSRKPLASVEQGTVCTPRSRKKTVLSQHQKFRKASILFKDVVALISEESGKRFEDRLKVMVDIKNAWEDKKEVEVIIKAQDAVIHEEIEIEVGLHEETRLNVQDQTEEVFINDLDIFFADNFEELGLHDENQHEEIEVEREDIEDDSRSAVLTEHEAIEVEREDIEEDSRSAELTEHKEIEVEREDIEEDSRSTVLTEQSLNNIVMPKAIRKRGRPKGSENTVIGIKKKRLKRTR